MVHNAAKITDMARELRLTDKPPVGIPTDPRRVKLYSEETMLAQTPEEERQVARTMDVRSVMGKLNNLVVTTRPDVAFALVSLQRFQSNPGLQVIEELEHIVKYLYKTRKRGINLGGNKGRREGRHKR